MKRLSTGALTLLIAAGFGVSSVIAAPNAQTQGNTANSAFSLSGVKLADNTMMSPAPTAPEGQMAPPPAAPAAPAPAMMTPAMPPADFGAPPSGEVPILFNDHHVYSKPSALRTGRVLAALVRGNSILVPLRSLFEQTGATVSYDPASKTVDVSKPGSDVKLTVGRPEVIINGESRPLDVPPEIKNGTVLVPLRVLAEGMGAYVQWVPDRKVVVVRYVVATPPPPPAMETTEPVATPVPTEAPTPEPTKAVVYERYVAGDYLFQPKVYNAFNNGKTGNGAGGSFGVKGAVEFPLFNLPWMVGADYRAIRYPVVAGSTAYDAFGNATNFTSTSKVKVYDLDTHFGLKIADPRIYIGVGYLFRSESTGYPNIRGLGFGVEKLPDLDQQLSIFGSAYYYPNAKSKGEYIVNGQGYTVAYRILKYAVGGAFVPGNGPVYINFGWEGTRGINKQNAPSNFSENGPFVGIGVHF